MPDTRSFASTRSSSARSFVENDTPLEKPTRNRPQPTAASRTSSAPGEVPRSAFRAWPEIRAQLLAANHWAFFLDFDGTLVNLRRRPSDVRFPAQANRLLQRLVRRTKVYVAIVSGRSVQALRGLVAVEGLHYFGLHGAERDGESAKLTPKSRVSIEHAVREAQARLGAIRGIWIEDKGLSFSVHHRDADEAAAEAAGAVLGDLLAPWRDHLHILNGSRVWEVLPKEIPGKAAVVEEVLRQRSAPAAVVYLGDDGTDEMAFSVLSDQITVRVGRDSGTRARYLVRNPKDALRFLARVEKELP
jgi:trehalose 6-phosphate phosphatase